MSNTASTVAAAFAAAAARWPARPFIAVLAETAAIYGIAAGELSYADAQRRIDSYMPAGRFGEPAEIADLALYLATTKATFL